MFCASLRAYLYGAATAVELECADKITRMLIEQKRSAVRRGTGRGERPLGVAQLPRRLSAKQRVHVEDHGAHRLPGGAQVPIVRDREPRQLRVRLPGDPRRSRAQQSPNRRLLRLFGSRGHQVDRQQNVDQIRVGQLRPEGRIFGHFYERYENPTNCLTTPSDCFGIQCPHSFIHYTLIIDKKTVLNLMVIDIKRQALGGGGSGACFIDRN